MAAFTQVAVDSINVFEIRISTSGICRLFSNRLRCLFEPSVALAGISPVPSAVENGALLAWLLH